MSVKIFIKNTLRLSAALAITLTVLSAQAEVIQTPVFVSGQDGYDTYRIPAVVTSKQGTVLAFCEGRMAGRSDTGNIDLLVKRSIDNGVTWSQQHVVWDDAGNTCGNPAPVVDEKTGTIYLLMTWNRGDDHEKDIIAGKSKDTRRVYVTQSDDDGVTWSSPKEITSTIKKPNWTWYATGPGAGIQLLKGKYKGRLVIPCDFIEAETKQYYSHVIYSDDHGASWELGGVTPEPQVNECEVVELNTGELMLNMRNYDRAKHQRQVAISDDGGATWTTQRHDTALIEPICQASIRRVGKMRGTHKRDILFSNPAHEKSRVNMTVRLSRDNGATWPHALVLHEGPSAYSDLVVLDNKRIACLYERGDKHAYETITFATSTFNDLLPSD